MFRKLALFSAVAALAAFAAPAAAAPAAGVKKEASMALKADKSGYADVNGIKLYYAVYGKGEPLVLLHGGLGHAEMMAPVIARLASGRQVIVADLQGHGRTADVDRPIRYETMGDDIAALIRYLKIEKADVMGYSMGGGVALRTAIQHPDLVDRLVVVSAVFRRDGWFADIRAQQEGLNGSAAEAMKPTPMYQSYVAVAPRPEDFSRLLDKMGAFMKRDYDWAEEVRGLASPTMLVFADHDMMPTSHMAEFFGLLGGGKKDAGWMGENMTPHRLAILPGLTHYNAFLSPSLPETVLPFLDGEADAPRWGETPVEQ
ncbi:MAG: alpha/beta hydrolase [Amphiplicatus sp.]